MLASVDVTLINICFLFKLQLSLQTFIDWQINICSVMTVSAAWRLHEVHATPSLLVSSSRAATVVGSESRLLAALIVMNKHVD